MLSISGLACFTKYLIQILLTFPRIVKTKSLAPADGGMANNKCAFKVLGQTIHLDGALFGGAREIYGRKVYFALPSFSLKSTDVVIDLGANAGVFTTLAAVLARKVVAVEAQSRFINEIYSNLKNNKCADKAFVEFGLVGTGTGVFSNLRNLKLASHFEKLPSVLSIYDIITRHHLKTINFVKIDIEGSEFGLFDSDIGWLSCVEKLVMEVHLEFGDVNKVVSVLANNGFDVWLVDNDQHVVDQIEGTSGYLFAKHKAPGSTALSRT